MRFGAHLPLIDFGDGCLTSSRLRDYVLAARDAGFDTLAANDHFVWRTPWLDGPTALAAATAHAGSMTLATTVALPTLRHPVVLAKALTSLAALHAGPIIAGIGPGSSRDDYDAVGVPFEQRWSRFDAAARRLRELLANPDTLRPGPEPTPQIWFASWGSPTRLRATAAFADGWMASGYHSTPSGFAQHRARLDDALRAAGRDPAAFPDMVATIWFQITGGRAETTHILHDVLGPALSRDPDALARQLPIGSPQHCIDVLSDYVHAGARRILLWPIRDAARQLARCAEEITPQLPTTT